MSDDPTEMNTEFSQEFETLYALRGVLPHRPRPTLARCCPDGQACWKGLTPRGGTSKDPDSENDSIFLPWVGPDYRRGGVCVVGINLNVGKGSGTWWGTERKIADEQRTALALAAGEIRVHDSHWAFATSSAAAVVLRSLDGRSGGAPEGAELVAALDRTARVQSVKCSPPRVDRGSPEPAMWQNCPPRFLGAELEILKPNVLLVYGKQPKAAVRALGVESDVERVGRFRRLTLSIADRDVTVFCLTHTGHGGWRADKRPLEDSLLERPLS